ncbi:hypothetical protein AB0K41_42030 [Actinomadura coerulea]
MAAYGRAFMTNGTSVLFRQADPTDPDLVLYELPGLFDPGRPAAMVAADSLTHIGRRDTDLGTTYVAELLNTYMTAPPDGSALANTHLLGDGLDDRIRCRLDATSPTPQSPTIALGRSDPATGRRADRARTRVRLLPPMARPPPQLPRQRGHPGRLGREGRAATVPRSPAHPEDPHAPTTANNQPTLPESGHHAGHVR